MIKKYAVIKPKEINLNTNVSKTTHIYISRKGEVKRLQDFDLFKIM